MFNIFRQKSLDRLSSPERLDQLIQVVRPRGWWWLSTQGALITAVVVWSIWGRIPTTVTGQGILVVPRDVVQIESLTGGRLVQLKIKLGDLVEKGIVIATLDQPDLMQQLRQQRQKLADLQVQFQAENTTQAQQNQFDRAQIQQQRQNYRSQIQQAQAFGNLLKSRNLAAIRQQQQSSEAQLQRLQPLSQSLQQILKSQRQLNQEGAISKTEMLQTEQEYLQALEQIGSLTTQLNQLKVQETQIEQQYQENLDKITALQAQLSGLDSQAEGLALKSRQTQDTQQQQLRDGEQAIARLQQQLKEQGRIVSTYSGKVLELNVVPGQVINTAQSIATLERTDLSGTSTGLGLAYFTIGDGKKIQPGMEMQVTPATVTREEYGGILATVQRVDAFPVNAQTVGVIIGAPDLAGTLTSNGRVIQVRAALQANSTNFSGYAWSSGKGPQLQVSPGTTTTALVTVEQRAPITFVIPLLRSITGLR